MMGRNPLAMGSHPPARSPMSKNFSRRSFRRPSFASDSTTNTTRWRPEPRPRFPSFLSRVRIPFKTRATRSKSRRSFRVTKWIAVVIGRVCKNVKRENALEIVLGYTCTNLVSARDWQLKHGGGQWCRGKFFDTFAPMGPCLVTPDEIQNRTRSVSARPSGEWG